MYAAFIDATFSWTWFFDYCLSSLEEDTKNKQELAVAHPQGGSFSTVSRSNWNLDMLAKSDTKRI